MSTTRTHLRTGKPRPKLSLVSSMPLSDYKKIQDDTEARQRMLIIMGPGSRENEDFQAMIEIFRQGKGLETCWGFVLAIYAGDDARICRRFSWKTRFQPKPPSTLTAIMLVLLQLKPRYHLPDLPNTRATLPLWALDGGSHISRRCSAEPVSVDVRVVSWTESGVGKIAYLTEAMAEGNEETWAIGGIPLKLKAGCFA